MKKDSNIFPKNLPLAHQKFRAFTPFRAKRSFKRTVSFSVAFMRSFSYCIAFPTYKHIVVVVTAKFLAVKLMID